LTVGQLFRAALQNMADNYHTCALRLSPECKWNRLVFSGGLAQKIDLLRRMICDKFGADYRMSPSSEDSLLGLLALALTFSGRAPSVQQAMVELAQQYGDELGCAGRVTCV
jgi:sugar (pentulose or hexulose) kinase